MEKLMRAPLSLSWREVEQPDGDVDVVCCSIWEFESSSESIEIIRVKKSALTMDPLPGQNDGGLFDDLVIAVSEWMKRIAEDAFQCGIENVVVTQTAGSNQEKEEVKA